MNTSWFIQRDGLYHWPGGWIPMASHAQSYPTEADAKGSLEALAKTHPSAFGSASVVQRTLVIDPSTGRVVEVPDTSAARPVEEPPVQRFVVPVLPEPEETAQEEEPVHPADVPQGAGDADQVKTKYRRQQITVQHERAALARFLADPGGHAWMRRLLGVSNAFQSCFSPDPYFTAFSTGKQDIARFIMGEVEAAGDAKLLAQLLSKKVDHAS